MPCGRLSDSAGSPIGARDGRRDNTARAASGASTTGRTGYSTHQLAAECRSQQPADAAKTARVDTCTLQGADELIDVAAMVLTCRVIGFHPLLLPTFALEFLPIVDWLPTWTGCVAIVVALRKREQTAVPSPADPGPFIDV